MVVALKVSETKAAVDALEKEVGFCLRGYVAGTSVVPKHLRINVSNLADYLTDTLGLTSGGTYTQTDTDTCVQTDRQTDTHTQNHSACCDTCYHSMVCPSVCVLSLTLVHPAKAAGQTEMPFGKDTCVVSSNIVLHI